MATDKTRTQQRGFLSRELIIKESPGPARDNKAPGPCRCAGLADRLGVAPNALYTYVRGKADLIDGLVDQVYAGLELDPDPPGDWPQQLTTLSQDVRAPPARPPRRGPLRPPTTRPRPPQPAPRRSHLQRPAAGRVLRPGHRRHRLCPVDLHPGVVALEVPRAGTDPQTSDEFVRRRRGFFAALPPGEFPHTVQLAPLLARISTDDQFQFGIHIFLAGLQAQQPTAEHST